MKSTDNLSRYIQEVNRRQRWRDIYIWWRNLIKSFNGRPVIVCISPKIVTPNHMPLAIRVESERADLRFTYLHSIEQFLRHEYNLVYTPKERQVTLFLSQEGELTLAPHCRELEQKLICDLFNFYDSHLKPHGIDNLEVFVQDLLRKILNERLCIELIPDNKALWEPWQIIETNYELKITPIKH